MTYDLPLASVQKKIVPNVQVTIAEPTSIAFFDTQNVVARAQRAQVGYVAGVQWADRLPLLLQARLRQFFQDATRSGVAKSRRMFRLETEIRSFEVNYALRKVSVSLFAKLFDVDREVPIAADLFSAERAFPEEKKDQKKNIIPYFDSLTSEVFQNLIAWISLKI